MHLIFNDLEQFEPFENSESNNNLKKAGCVLKRVSLRIPIHLNRSKLVWLYHQRPSL